MTILDRYNDALDVQAASFRAEAAEALRRGDERGHSIALMRASMLGEMLKVLGGVEHTRRRGTLQAQIERCEAQAAKHEARQDFDSADRERLKAQTIGWAKATLERLEAEHE